MERGGVTFVPVYGPSGGFAGMYPEWIAPFVKAANDAECEQLRNRGDGRRASGEKVGDWYTEQELEAMRERAQRGQRAFMEGLFR